MATSIQGDYTMNANGNLQSLTRASVIPQIRNQVFLKSPLMAALVDAKKINWRGGTLISKPVQKANADSLAQDYTVNEPMTAQRKTVMETPQFHLKFKQIPIVYDVQEELMNQAATDSNAKILDLVETLTRITLSGIRISLYKNIWYDGLITNASDTQSGVQSIRHALYCAVADSSTTYGGITRTSSGTAASIVNQWWQGADINMWASSTANATSCAASIDTFRKAKDACDEHLDDTPNYLAITGPKNYRRLKAYVDAKRVDTSNGSLAKYGFDTFTIDGVQVVKDAFLTEANLAGWEAGATNYPDEAFVLLNINDWEFRIAPSRNFKMTPFKWQGDQPNGLDQHMARVLLAANLVCWKPNGSILLNAMNT